MEVTRRIIFLAKLLASVQAITYLERGSQGSIHCPLITSKRFSPASVDAMYWYFNGRTTPFLLVSHWQGRVHVKEGLPEGVYDVDSNYSLVINNVTDSMEGNYVFKLKPIRRMIQIGDLPVSVKVSPKTSRPRVVGCDVDDTSSSDCDVTVNATTQTHNLTCIVENAKPAVNITVTRLFGTDRTEPVNYTETNHELRLPENSTRPDRFEINNTFTTSVSISVPLQSDGVQKYRCEASGVAVGGANNHVTVTIRRKQESKPGISYDLASDDATKNAGNSLTSIPSVLMLMATIAINSAWGQFHKELRLI